MTDMSTTETLKSYIYCQDPSLLEKCQKLSQKSGLEIHNELLSPASEYTYIAYNDDRLTLYGEDQEISADFRRMLPRLKINNLNGEMIVKACGLKNFQSPPRIVDATAGFGEDSFLLAAKGCTVKLFELDPVIYSLLDDSIIRGMNDSELKDAVSNMSALHMNSIEYLNTAHDDIDIVVLDPMFPKRQKSGLVKKKFQLIHNLEKPCDNEEELLNAAIRAKPKKIVIKRPGKGSYLANVKPTYSIEGKSIRYDIIVL